MFKKATLLAVMSLNVLHSSVASAADPNEAKASAVLAVMPDGIGDLTFASAEWVEAAQEVLSAVDRI